MEIRTIEPFLQYFRNVRERTMRVARCIAPEKIDWTYAPGKFTLGDLLRHLAVAERWIWAETLSGRPSAYTTHGKELAGTYEDIIAFMERLHAESLEIFEKLIHHRGQIYLYLGILGVPTPPLYGLTSEEVRARSFQGKAQGCHPHSTSSSMERSLARTILLMESSWRSITTNSKEWQSG